MVENGNASSEQAFGWAEHLMTTIAPKVENLAPLIYLVRGEKVLLDADLAGLYGVTTKVLNQAVRRNINRFPADFMFQLDAEEWNGLKSQFVISNKGRAPNWSQFVTSSAQADALKLQPVTNSRKHRGATYRPFAFTEQGVAMLSSVLRSSRAVEVIIAIMRTFAQLRRLMDSNRDLARRIEALERRYDEQFANVFEAIKRLIADDEARKARPKRSIGFVS